MQRILIVFFCFALIAGILPAAEEGVIEVEAAGIGKDADAAVKNALRNAVHMAVGVMVDSNTIIENDEVITDKILSHSAAYVQKHEIIGEPEAKDGFVSLKIKAQVKRTQLASGLAAEQIAVMSVSGQSLAGEAMTKSEARKTAPEMFREIIKDFTDGYVGFAIEGEPRMDDKGEKMLVGVRFTLDVEKTQILINRLSDFLNSSALRAYKKERIRTTRQKNGRLKFPMQKFSAAYHQGFWNVSGSGISLVSRINDEGTLTLWQDFSIDKEMAEVLKQIHNKRSSMRIELIDADGEVIEYKDFAYLRPYLFRPKWLYIMPVLASQSDAFEAIPGTTSAVYYYSFDLFEDEIAEIKDIRISLVKN